MPRPVLYYLAYTATVFAGTFAATYTVARRLERSAAS